MVRERSMKILDRKKIILGITGGIAAYKSIEILRNLQKRGAEVRVIMTQNATHFVTPLTFSILSGAKVFIEMFRDDNITEIEHISVTEDVDLFLIAPATANIIGKFARGIADDFLSTLYLSCTAPLLMAPAMNWKMYDHVAVQENLDILASRGAQILEPEEGDLACRELGKGRLAAVERVIDKVVEMLTPKPLKGKRVLVTAGPTREHWDAFRFISNPSSGKMGYALARTARNKGAHVTLISGPSSLPVPPDVSFIAIESAEEMYEAVLERFDQQDAVLMAAAVSDFRPLERKDFKLKKERITPTLELAMNPDILKTISAKKSHQILVGFAAETGDLLTYAHKKIVDKDIDMIVANPIGSAQTGFSADTNKGIILFKNGLEEEIPLLTKDEVAMIILDRMESLFPV